MKELKRCDWCLKDDIYKKYHDEIWGTPEHDDIKLFEKLNLDGAQAGLSWYTILVRTESYRKAFDYWDIEKIARYNQQKVDELLQNPGIIRNKLKVNAVITNANAYLKLKDSGQTLNNFLWQFVNFKPQINHYNSIKEVPAKTPLSDKISKALQKAGFKFVGSTIVYAYMQAIGMVDDHLDYCWKKSK